MASAGAIGWGLLICAGWITGFCSGLLGIGGGLLIVPAMILGLPMLGVSGPELTKIATATSLLLIIPTSIASAQAHASRGSLDWALWGALAPSIVAGGLVTSMLIQHISASLVTLMFVAFSLFSAWRLLGKQAASAAAFIDLTPARLVAMSVKGVLGGALSTAIGAGVAFFAVPMLSRYVPMGRAIGTASMLALPMAAAGAAGYLFAPSPEGCASCTGYVHLPAVAAVGVSSVIAAPLGAQLTQTMPVQRLRQLFALLLICGAVSLLFKKLPELSAGVQIALAAPFLAWPDKGSPASAPEWLGQTSGPSAHLMASRHGPRRSYLPLLSARKAFPASVWEPEPSLDSGAAPTVVPDGGDHGVPLPDRRSRAPQRSAAAPRGSAVRGAIGPRAEETGRSAPPLPANHAPDLMRTLYGR